jgi:Methyltransferase domain
MLKTLIRRLTKTDQILQQQEATHQLRMKIAQQVHDTPKDSLEILPANPYARYALPIEYLPSRSFFPRWGYTKPAIPCLYDWFSQYTDHYQALLNAMRQLKVEHIAKSLQDTILPKPAWIGGPISPFDALVLYSMVYQYKPKRYIEIGSGITTCFTKQAIVDFQLNTQIISIDPEPRAEIDTICDCNIRQGLEDCDLTVFDQLEAGDILFLDGSHRTFMNSDVTVFFIDVLPKLKPGVVIHIHDICLPYDYLESFKHWYWSEQYMLAVYLMNAKDKIYPIAPTAFICRHAIFSNQLKIPFIDLGNEYNEGWEDGGSMWFTQTK